MMKKHHQRHIGTALIAAFLLAAPVAAHAQQAVSPTEVDQVMGAENLPTRPASVRPAYIPHQEASLTDDADYYSARQMNKDLETKRMLGLF